MMLVDFFKETITFIFAIVYALFQSLKRERANRIVIFYHGVKKINVRQFKKQMMYLANHCKVVRPSEINTVGDDHKHMTVAITFDDGFMSVMENAVPVLQEYGLPAGIFVPVGNLNQKPNWELPEKSSDKNEVVMTKDHLRKLDNEGVEIFSHTVTHPRLSEIEDDRLQIEIKESKRILEEILGHDVIAISYPYGAHNAEVCNASREAGYKYGFTIVPDVLDYSQDNMRLSRFEVLAKDSLFKFRLIISGAYSVSKFLQNSKRSVLRAVLLKI